ncbi:MAG: ABC transporter permease [Lachnospiraceae bacterium]|jgi:putative ABC transport system permease protein|nr:ABC transporter permease [Lachnospiraceae bacterium]
MWKEYSSDYRKNNPASSLSVRISAFISALLLSLLCGLFYNMWKYEVERIALEDGAWQSRLVGEIDNEALESIRNFATIKDAVINEKKSQDEETITDLYFYDYRDVLKDTPRIAELAGIPAEKTLYHHQLLAMYLIRDPQDTAPRLLFPLFILITLMASFSLVVIIHNSFAVSMNARIHQFGIFSSIGATPKQIRACLLQEAASLCALPLVTGNLLGIAGAVGLMLLTNVLLGSDIPGRHEAAPGYHPLVFLVTLLLTLATIWISAWIPARKLSRLTPLEAIRNTGELQLKHRKKSPVLSLLFGVEGELAGNALRAQRRALRTASLSLVFSFMAFTAMQCFFSLSGISTRETYFEKYQDAWDIYITLKDVQVENFPETENVRTLAGVRSAIVYQKASAKRLITEAELSEEMKSFGGFSQAPGHYVTPADGCWLVNAPLVILDDNSFSVYCEQLGIVPRLDGAVIINRIRDVTNPDFRHPVYSPYLKKDNTGEAPVSILRQSGSEELTAEVPVLAYTEQLPALREEYATLNYYELVHFLPASLWKEIKGQLGNAENEAYICVLGTENASLEELNDLQSRIGTLISPTYTVESENRIQEYETNNTQIQGMKAGFGGFCVLLAVIGIGNVFSNTLGFVRQRKREFARYMSVGLTPASLRKMFCIEALVLAGRPILVTLPLTAIGVGLMLKMSYVAPAEFLAEAPLVPIALFMLAILACVALGYSLAWRNMRKINLAEVLRDDTMM